MDFIKKNINKINRNGEIYINNGNIHVSRSGGGAGNLSGNYLPATMDEDGNYVVDLDKVTFNGSIIAEKEVSSYGVSSGTGSGSTGSDVDIIDNLTSNRTDAALSANMGRELKSLIDGINVGSGVSSWNDLKDKPELLTAENIAKWNNQTHTHTNKTILDGIDDTYITNWNDAYTHISDTIKHITAAERLDWNDANSKKHTHTNKTVLDGITSTKVGNWDNASTNSHTHTNKAILDGITDTNITNWNNAHTHISDTIKHITTAERTNWIDANSKKHIHVNKTILDNITDTNITNWNKASTNNHTHTNKTVLDGITATKVGNWDSVYTDWNNVFEIDGDKVKCKLNFVGEKEVSSYGLSDTAGSGGSGSDIIDNLTSNRTDAALSANMGRELKSLIDTKTSVSDWDDIQNKPSTFPPSQHTHSIYCLNNQSPTVDLNTINGTGIMNNPANADATTARNYPIAEAGIMIYGTTAYGSANQIYGSYNTNRWFARGGGERNSSGNPVKTSWKEFAFKTDIPASLKNPNALTISLNGTSQGAYDGSAAKSINITPANIGAAASSHIHSYLPLSGGTMTGSIKFPANQSSGAYAIDANNSDIVNVNGLFTNDSAQNATEGINFKRSNGKYDSLWALDGTLYFSPNGNNEDRNLNDYSANYKIWHAGNDGSGSGLDADTLDGIQASHILERALVGATNSGTATGWFRIAQSFDTFFDNYGISCLLFINRSYAYASNESYTFSINIAYGGCITITQLSGTFNTLLIDKIRVTGNSGSRYYIDLHIATSTTSNNYYWATVGGFQSLDSWIVNPSAGSNTKEFAVVQGIKTDSTKSVTSFQLGSTVTLSASSTNPYLRLTQGTNWFIQGYNNMLQLGAGTANSIKIDSVGNIILPSASVNSIKFNGGSSEQIGGEIYFNGTRTCIGRTNAGDFNAGSILVSNAWADYTKVPTNGIYSKGNILSAGEVTSYSDERLKSDIKPLDNRGYVKPVTYTKDGKESIGFIAQEMQKVYPELVTEDNSEEKYLSINYAQYTAVLQQQIIELKDELDKLKEEIKALKDGNK